MPTVYRVDTKSRKKIKIFIPDALWDRMKKKPNVFKSQFEYETIPKMSPIYTEEITDRKSPIYSGISKEKKAHDDLGDVAPQKAEPPKYTEEKYREDLKSARLLLNAGNKKDALFIYQRAFKFRESPYVKKQIKILS
jgi:hypothetical protein